MANINVLVVVDTVNITNENINQTVVLIDDNLDHDTQKDDSSTFTIKCNAGDFVTFRITSVNQTTNITFGDHSHDIFIFEEGQNCFDPLPSASNNWTGTVQGNEGDHENFGIPFTINGDRCYTLDPEIRVQQGG